MRKGKKMKIERIDTLEFDTLTKGEIKKINKAGNGRVGEYFAKPSEVKGFYDVVCSIFDDDFENIIATVEMAVCLFDRRKSFVSRVK